MSMVTTDDEDANEAELLVDPRDPRERKEPWDFELRSDAWDEDDARDEVDGDERKGICVDESSGRTVRSSDDEKRDEVPASNPNQECMLAG